MDNETSQNFALPAGGTPGSVPLDQPAYGVDMRVAVERFFKRWRQVRGRSSQSEFWWAYLALFLASFVLGLVPFVGIVLNLLLSIVIVVPAITLTIRRLHDSNLSGWWLTIPAVGQLLSLASMVLFFVAFWDFYLYTIHNSDDNTAALELIDVPLLITSASGLALAACFTIASVVLLARAPRAEGRRFDGVRDEAY